MFTADSALLHIANHTSYMFHCTIGLDPLGNFSAVEGLTYEITPFEYNELGRNHSPWQLPLSEPGKPGQLTLRWGMIVRSKLYEWIHEVDLGTDFRRHVYIFQLSKKKIPIRVYHLTGAWPVSWKGTDLSSEGAASMSTVEVTLVYEQIDLFNMSAVAMAADLIGSLISSMSGGEEGTGAQDSVSGDAATRQQEYLAFMQDQQAASIAENPERVAFLTMLGDAGANRERLDAERLEREEALQQELDDAEARRAEDEGDVKTSGVADSLLERKAAHALEEEQRKTDAEEKTKIVDIVGGASADREAALEAAKEAGDASGTEFTGGASEERDDALAAAKEAGDAEGTEFTGGPSEGDDSSEDEGSSGSDE